MSKKWVLGKLLQFRWEHYCWLVLVDLNMREGFIEGFKREECDLEGPKLVEKKMMSNKI